MSTIKTNAILDASGGSTTTINGVTPNAYNTMGKNLIINGDARIWQRATSSSSTGINSVDRWYHAEGTFSQETSIVPTNFQYAIKCVTNASNTPLLLQKIERPQVCGHIIGQDITVSFYARSSNVNAITKLELNDEGGSGGRPDGGAKTLAAADTWERITHTFTAPFSSLTGNSVAVILTFANSATVYITGVQLEVGSTATEFERRPYGTELALCQRYCYVIDASNSSYATAGNAIAFSTNYAIVNTTLPVSMRTKYTSLTISNNAHWLISDYNNDYAWSSFVLNSSNSTPNIVIYEGTTATTLTAGRTYVARAANNTSAKLTFSAEL